MFRFSARIVSSWLAVVLLSQSDVHAISLTTENFAAETGGKAVFIKFFAPWCGHCRAMADDWKKLEDEWSGHEVGLVAEVDCTSDEGQPICEDFQVEGFPTIMYGDPLAAETYDGPRDYESLAAFAKEHISKPICSVFRIEACDEEETKLIESLQAKSSEELEGMVQKVTELVQLEEAEFNEKVMKVQEQYDAIVTEFNNKLNEIKKTHHYKFVDQMLTSRFADSLEEMELGQEQEL
ncbi:thioredoxin [Nitzschia inconspicua]|uniref:Thioredoxin n=1 Tax=Nitzschia inconspicua TaxID=303405 RepID=A0A9K3PL81_9STRA|nr:thioredoxin [Nitzschia inconspicua]